MKKIYAVFMLLFFPVLCFAAADAAKAETAEKKIVFVSTRDGRDIYIMNMDGSRQTRLTSLPDYFSFDDPRVSPDNRQILATGIPYAEGAEETQSDLYLLKPDGTGVKRITDGKWVKKQGCWFPSGDKIVYSSNKSGRFGLVILDIKTGTEVYMESGEYDDMSAQVSSDGKFVVFESNKNEINSEGVDGEENYDLDVPDGRNIPYLNDENGKIYIADADGKNRKRLTNDYGRQGSPFWSADSQKIYYYKYMDAGFPELWKMDPDGGNKEQAAEFDQYSEPGMPAWLDNGVSALFSMPAENNPQRQICIVDENFRVESFITSSLESENFAPQIITAPARKKGFLKKITDKITGKGGKIVFATSRDGGLNVYIMNSDGTGQMKLTDTNLADSPSLSRGCKKIAYCDYVIKDKSTQSRIFIMNADGTGKRAIEEGPVFRSSPEWSPDGRRIVFTGYEQGKKSEIFIINEDGTGLKQLTNDDYYDTSPSWSPDGKNIVFVSVRGSNGKIFTIGIDGKNQKQITDGPDSQNDDTPCWSPDGRRILFSRNYILMTVKPDGTSAREIGSEINGSEAVWSPDGKKIALRPYGTNEGVYVIKSDGTGAVDITNSTSMNIQPSWK